MLGRSEETEPLPRAEQAFQDRKVGVGRRKNALSFGRGSQRAKGEGTGTNSGAELREGAAQPACACRGGDFTVELLIS